MNITNLILLWHATILLGWQPKKLPCNYVVLIQTSSPGRTPMWVILSPASISDYETEISILTQSLRQLLSSSLYTCCTSCPTSVNGSQREAMFWTCRLLRHICQFRSHRCLSSCSDMTLPVRQIHVYQFLETILKAVKL